MIMKSHHDAGDDTARVVGAIRSLTVAEDGSARFTAELADTSTGRDIAALVKGTASLCRRSINFGLLARQGAAPEGREPDRGDKRRRARYRVN